MKKLINDPRHAVRELLEGLTLLHPEQALLTCETVVVRRGLADAERREVALVSGGGSGHEPAHAGYVGAGMLHAAVAGDVFTSPSVDAVLAAIRAVGGPAGVLLIVKNYTGDRLNFGLAAELAASEGIPCEVVLVADDVALRHTVEPAQRRGIAGTVLVHKVAGAAAAAGLALAEVAAEARVAAAAVGSMGVALGACTVPAAGKPGFELGPDEIELGLGIHGEPGVARAALESADTLVDTLAAAIIEDRGLRAGDRVALLVNGLGGTPPMELAILARRAIGRLRDAGLRVERAWAGTFLSALEMPGFSLSILPVDDPMLARIDAPTTAPAWPGGGHVASALEQAVAKVREAPQVPADGAADPATAAVLLGLADACEKAESLLAELDSKAGDGDLGASFERGGRALRALAETAPAEPASALRAMSDVLRRALGGSSGPFYAVALLRAARALPEAGSVTPAAWAAALRAGVDAIGELGGARPGDRTMLDALSPAAEAFARTADQGGTLGDALRACLEAAREGVAATESMKPRLGRAAYLGDRALGVPDAGARGVVVWLEALSEMFLRGRS